MKRKSPIRHRVKSHNREGKSVRSFERGKGVQPVKLKIRKKVLGKPIFIMEDAPHLTKYHPEAQKLVWMEPERFSKLVPPLIFVDKGSLSRIKGKIQKGEPQEPLWMEVNPISDRVTHTHEGRHRALASAQIGVKKVPVIIYFKDHRGFRPLSSYFSVDDLKPFSDSRPYG